MEKPEGSVQRVFSGAVWEPSAGYCRGIRSGKTIAVSGTTSLDDQGKLYAPGDPYEQAKRCLQIIEKALLGLGAERKHVIRTRMFVTDVSRFQEFARAHGEFFKDCPPASSMLGISGLVDLGMLIEIEADAVISD
ncbi:hypothetical protein KFL_001010150 [Klebsormidium nitens]|uniref:RidA family protein n=1 Tax=Klebsormidium nitens TaxID=105231 RepID=A0A1Y1HU28_KLENI|nr:hypothetical protein KFL_001010150 [Klebsormidium nitens]|eukprot:GAQ82130.1 hypothetical protein KFL_001010150 [Klebsormidium nitens]